ncbi:CAAX protease self-immunity [Bifidobacterium stellenboschense]|uniref:CAAX protease self-immunity n=2 Tax=Bifidobacterium stellenboschense TaxID=762211 RepID=A0A087DRB2_9BIFI|nr:CAAX protease self-immunity [Bifidobacterium stellenboschense]
MGTPMGAAGAPGSVATPGAAPLYPSQPQLQPQYQPQPMWPTYYAQPMPMAVPTFAAIDPRAWWRTWRRKVVNRAMGLTLAYDAVMMGVSIVAGIVFGAIYAATNPGGSSSSYDSAFNRWSGIMSLVAVFSAVGFLILMRHRDIFTREYWLGGPHRETYGETNQIGTISQYGARRMTPLACLAILVVALGVQGVIVLIQLAFSMFGTDLASPTSDSINESAITVSMWLYIGLIGPICEEMMFRGVLMKELKPLGKNFAILTSAIAFGLFHDDVVQGFFAFLFGLVLGYVAMEYSLVWSIALHIFNNAILSGVIDGLASHFLSNMGYGIFSLALALGGVVGAIIVLIVGRKQIGGFLRVNRSGQDTYFGWTSWAFIVFVAINALLAITSFVSAMLG